VIRDSLHILSQYFISVRTLKNLSRVVLIFMMFAFCISNRCYSQEKLHSFVFNSATIGEAIGELSEAYGYLVSYDPKIMENETSVNLEINQKTLQEAFNSLLGNRFNFKIIKDYVVITKKPTELAFVKKPVPKPSTIIHDTIFTEIKKVVYDTQRIEVKKLIYDTVYTERIIPFYDTISIENQNDITINNWRYKIFISPHFLDRKIGANSSLYNGFKSGLSVNYSINKFKIAAGINYNYLFSNVSFSQSEVISTLQIDTISTFFVVEDGIRTPVHVIDSILVTSQLNINVDRLNTIQYLSFELSTGYDFKLKEIELGILLGFTFDWILNADEVLALNDSNNLSIFNSPSYNSTLINFQMQIPTVIKKIEDDERIYLTPYFQYGINKSFIISELEDKRYLLGFRLGYLF